jgi:hypothetical protein
MTTLQKFIEENDESGLGRFSWLMTDLVEEMTEELAGKDTETMALYMAQIGEVISWVGHGDDTRLSENIRHFTRQQDVTLEDESDTYIGTSA